MTNDLIYKLWKKWDFVTKTQDNASTFVLLLFTVKKQQTWMSRSYLRLNLATKVMLQALIRQKSNFSFFAASFCSFLGLCPT